MRTTTPLLLLLFLRAVLCAAPEAPSLLPSPATADTRVPDVHLRITPDHADWIYALGEPVKFHVTVKSNQQTVGGVRIKYQVGAEKMPAVEIAAMVTAKGLTIEGGTLKEPGFVRCLVAAELNGKTYRGLATVGFAPKKIRPTQIESADCDAFWAASKAELAQIPATRDAQRAFDL